MSGPNDETPAPAIPREAMVAVILLAAVNFISLFDRVQIAALAQPIKEEFGWSDVQIGLLTGTAFGLTYAFAALPLAWLSDRTNRTRLLAGTLACWSVMTSLAGFSQSFAHLFAVRMGVAAGEAAFTPTAHSIVADYYPPKRRGFAIGLETSGAMLGIMAGLSVAGFLGQVLGWRSALFIAGAPGLLLSLVILLVMKEPPRHEAPSAPTGRGGLRRALGSTYVLLLIGVLCSSIMTTAWTNWLPSFFIRTHGLSLASTGALVGVSTGLGLTVGSLAGGWLTMRAAANRDLKAIFRWCVPICAASVPCYALAIWSPVPIVALAGVFMSTTIAGMLSPFLFMGIQNSCAPRFRAQAVAYTLAIVQLGSGAIMPPLVGGLSDFFAPAFAEHSLRIALNVFLVFPLIAAAVLFRVSQVFKPQA